jgi:FtsP/CotA-like multicopper oxidase with cupredoxin domain
VAFACGLLWGASAFAAIQGLTGTSFNLTAKADYISEPDGVYLYFWGFADSSTGQAQFPGPTLIVPVGATVSIHLENQLPEPVSLIFPGLEGPTTPVYDPSGRLRSLAHEAPPGGSADYTFVASAPGTYFYESGTRLDKQIPLGLFGVIIVRPPNPSQAYDHPDTRFDREFLILLDDMDDRLNEAVEQGRPYDPTAYITGYWHINGRSAMDTLSDANAPWLPTQPYDAVIRIHPEEKILVRFVNLGRAPHPFHTHGNHVKVIARDGRLLESSPGAGPDLAYLNFTLDVAPGQTWDGLFTWRAEALGWDIYGHAPGDPTEPGEYLPDHGKPIPVTQPYFTSLIYGEFYSGSPFLGQTGPLPPDVTRENETGYFSFMWHSHIENEITNKNDFPGGLITLVMVEAPWVPIP